MATVSHDGHTFLIDSRRVWLVSGAIHYPRVPRELWRSRIRAAKQAGLNCIETYVFWNAHEPSPGRFDFTGNLDLRAFVRTVGEEGMLCMVRPGPFICAEWDNGGLPPWLTSMPGMKPREGHPAFLEACSRYLQAVMEQIKDLQITELITPKSVKPRDAATVGNAGAFTGQGGGPIMLMQVENEWFCHNPEASRAYNDELLRYLREGGCTVPLNNCNNLWQGVDRTIDTWNGARLLAADLRQLRTVKPDAPRLVTEYWPGWFDQWGGEHARNVDPDLHLYRLAGMAAVGGQTNQYMFHGGTNFAFWGGRTVNGSDCFMTTSYDYDAPLLEAGGRGEKYLATKRLCVFLSQFGHVLAQAKPDEHHAVVALNEQSHPPAVLQLTGSGNAGDVVFILQSKSDRRDAIDLMLPNGLTLPVPLGGERAAWLALNVPLIKGVELTYTNLRPWAWLGRKMLVLYGPAGATGLVSLNDATFTFTVPAADDDRPLIETHEEIVVVVLNREQVDAAYIAPEGLVIGAAGLDDQNQPLPGRQASITTISLDGEATHRAVKPVRKPAAPRPLQWTTAGADALVRGDDDAYTPIDGPASLDALGQPYGYGWYRLAFPKAPRGGGKALAPQSADRLHVFADGQPAALIGLSAGATFDPVPLKLGRCTTILCDNLGRMNYSWRVGERKGLFGHVYAVKPVALGRPKVVAGRSPDPFELRGYIPQHRVGESRAADALVWKVKPTGKRPFILDIAGLRLSGVLFINGQPLDLYDHGQCARYGRWLLPGQTREIRLALFHPLDKSVPLGKHITLYQCTSNLTEAAQWSFAPVTVPDANAFNKNAASPGLPAWWRCTFHVKHTNMPLWIEPVGMTKGQIYLNGHNAGRYFVATADGAKVTPQERYYLPEPWLRTDGQNELILFDEHGARPTSVRFAYDALGPYSG
jgi:beta-galactosidase